MSKRARFVVAAVILAAFFQLGHLVFAQVRPPRTGGGITPPPSTLPFLSAQ